VAKEQTEHNMACMVCGTRLVYDKTSQEQECIYCGSTEASAIYCPDGHFVCDSCHSKDAIAFLELLAEVDTSTEPIDVVDKALTHPSFKFHGPEHHSLVPAAILIAMKNRGIPKTDGVQITPEVVHEGIRRGSKIPGGFCGYAGTCGACVGSGVAVALYIGSTPRSGAERKIAHAATTDAMYLSMDGLRRCCKRATYYGLTAAMTLLKKEFDIDLGTIPEVGTCKYSERNRNCEYENCIYFQKESTE
jgi:hypothetical protein